MSKEVLRQIWSKATPINGWSPDEWRRDRNGNVIRWSEYGKTTQYGWEVDHSVPKAQDGSDDISNLFPMRWRENREKSDKTQTEYESDEFIRTLRAIQFGQN